MPAQGQGWRRARRPSRLVISQRAIEVSRKIAVYFENNAAPAAVPTASHQRLSRVAKMRPRAARAAVQKNTSGGVRGDDDGADAGDQCGVQEPGGDQAGMAVGVEILGGAPQEEGTGAGR